MCGILSTTNCRSQSALCEASDFKFRLETAVKVPLKNKKLVTFETHNNKFPVTLRVADYNLDSFPDFIAITQSTSAPEQVPKIELFRNSECSEQNGCSQEETNNGLRTFTVETTGIEIFNSIAAKNATPYAAFFMDLDETVRDL